MQRLKIAQFNENKEWLADIILGYEEIELYLAVFLL
jgi:hypothetical protein